MDIWRLLKDLLLLDVASELCPNDILMEKWSLKWRSLSSFQNNLTVCSKEGIQNLKFIDEKISLEGKKCAFSRVLLIVLFCFLWSTRLLQSSVNCTILRIGFSRLLRHSQGDKNWRQKSYNRSCM